MPQAIKVGPHRAGVAHYPGQVDVVTHKPFGPTTYGTWVVAVSQEYDPAADRTTITFNYPEAVTA